MMVKIRIACIVLGLMMPTTWAGQQPALCQADYDWRDGIEAGFLEGRGFKEPKLSYARLPDRFKDTVTSNVWNLSRSSIGFCARFSTDSSEIAVRWRVPKDVDSGALLTYVQFAGIDVYSRSEEGGWQHVSAGAPNRKSGEGELRLKWNSGSECLIYLPARASVLGFSVGVRKGASFSAPRAHCLKKPIVHYGTSIVNGSCASRSGLALPAIMGRLVDMEVINLGFSGSGKMELQMADLVAEIDASLYLIDCEWNMDRNLIAANYEPFVRRLKELRPDVPVLLCGACTERTVPRETETLSRRIFERLQAASPEKWSNWQYLSGVGMLPVDSDCTLDHCHPNDWGFAQMGRVYADAVRKILRLKVSKVAENQQEVK